MVLNYHNTEVKTQSGGKKIVRTVTINRGKGYKSVTKYTKGKKTSSIKKPIHQHHIEAIKRGNFVPGLFDECYVERKPKHVKTKTKTRKIKH
jgi:hypothetical protein